METRLVKDSNGMMIPQTIADFYMPNTFEGRTEMQRLLEGGVIPDGMHVHFCSDYDTDLSEPRVCMYRKIEYMDGQNKCRRCPAGYMYEVLMGAIPEDESMPFEPEQPYEFGDEDAE